MRARAAGATALALACTLVLAGCDLGFSLGFGGKPDGHFEGMTITEVADVAGAYAIMTAEDLPEAAFPTPAASPTPLPTATEGPAEPGDGAFDVAIDSALARVESSLETATDATLVERSRAAADRARALRDAGDDSGAFAAAAAAADVAAVAGASDVDAASVGGTRTAAEDLLAAASQNPPETLDAADLSLEVIGAAADAYALAASAEAALAAGEEAAPTAAALAVSALARARESAALRDALGPGSGSISRDADLDGLGSLLRRAAIAATDAYESRAGEAPVRAGDLPAVRLAAYDTARKDLESIAGGDAWLGLALAATSLSRAVPPLVTQQAVRVPDGVDPTAAVQQRIAVGDEYAVRAVEALADAGAEVSLVRGALSDATATATAAPVPGASAVYATPFLRARVLAFAAGVERA